MDALTGFTLAKTGLGILGNYQAQDANRAAYNAYNDAMARANALISDPTQMYMTDPGLLQGRQMRMADVRAGQLARGGGLRGGAYARQLMKEGTALDAANLRNAVAMQMQLAGQYAPGAQAYSAAGGGGPWYAGAIGPISQGLSDYAWQSMMGQYNSQPSATAANQSTTPFGGTAGKYNYFNAYGY